MYPILFGVGIAGIIVGLLVLFVGAKLIIGSVSVRQPAVPDEKPLVDLSIQMTRASIVVTIVAISVTCISIVLTIVGWTARPAGAKAPASARATIEFLDPDHLYDTNMINDSNLRRLLVYAPVGLWQVQENDPKVIWLHAIQTRLKNQLPPFSFEGAYGIPPSGLFDAHPAANALAGFEGARNAVVRAFPPLSLCGKNSSALPTDAPGIGILLAEYKDRKVVLVGFATNPASVRVDKAFSVESSQAFDLAEQWYEKHVSTLGEQLDLTGAQEIQSEILSMSERTLAQPTCQGR